MKSQANDLLLEYYIRIWFQYIESIKVEHVSDIPKVMFIFSKDLFNCMAHRQCADSQMHVPAPTSGYKTNCASNSKVP